MPESLSFTGERVVPGQVDSNLLLEHLARYRLAARLAAGQRVFDAGCGTGYGSQILAAPAVSVCALDSAPEAIAYARKHYPAAGLSFVIGDCCRTGLSDAAFDLIVGFEIIEHIPNPEDFVAEMRRLLAPGGWILLSTPNRLISERQRVEPNPFHFRELDATELASLLGKYFGSVALGAQNPAEGMAICFPSLQVSDGAALTLDASGAATLLAEAQYLMAICAAEAEERPLVPNPFLLTSTLGNILHQRNQHLRLTEQERDAVRQRLSRIEQTLEERDQHLRLAQTESEQRRKRIEALDQEWSVRRQHLELLQQEVAAHKRRIEVLDRELVVKGEHLALMEQELHRERSKASDFYEQTTRLEQELHKSGEHRLQLDNRIKVLDSQIADLLTRLDGVTKELEAASQELEAASQEVETASQELASARGALADTQQAYDQTRLQLGRLENVLARLDASKLFRLLDRLPYFSGYLRRMRHPRFD